MPQLDLSMFFYHILAFSYFFFSIYVYMSASFIPNISSIMKYSKKLVSYFAFQKDFFFKKYSFFNMFLDGKVSFVMNSYLKIVLKFVQMSNLVLSFWLMFFNQKYLINMKNNLLNFQSMNFYMTNYYL